MPPSEQDLDDFGIDLNDDIDPAEVINDEAPADEASADKPADDKPAPEEPEDPVAPVEDEASADKPAEEEPAQPVGANITKEDLRSFLSDIRSEEQAATKQYDVVYSDIESRYYPNGISRVMVDAETGKPLRTAQDVMDLANNPDLTIEQAEQWRIQKQSEWDAQVRDIESGIRKIAEQTISLERGTRAVMERYESLFKTYPALETKVMGMYQKYLKSDKNTNTILEAPDIEEFFDFHLEPYRLAFEAGGQAAGSPAPSPAAPQAPEPPKPSRNDRMDEFGDGGGESADDADPDDFEAQLKKEFNND